MNIKHLHKEGQSIKAITRLTGHSRNTVRRLLRQSQPVPFQKPARTSRLDEFKPYLEQRYQECALSSVRLLQEIRSWVTPVHPRRSIVSRKRCERSNEPAANLLSVMKHHLGNKDRLIGPTAVAFAINSTT
jgi:transposase